ncbi:MAG: hypothetical protein ACXABK_04235, partial [Candidatus Heimdallarchaeaceae archaeon]
MSIPEAVIGNYSRKAAGTIDGTDLVGMDSGTAVVDLYDLKTLSPSSYAAFNGSEEEDGRYPKGMIKSPDGKSLYANGQNKAFAQLATYKSLYELGDESIGFTPVKVRNATIVKALFNPDNTIKPLTKDDFVTRNTEGDEFADFKSYGDSIINREMKPKSDTKIYMPKHSMLGQMLINPFDQSLNEVTGAYYVVVGEENGKQNRIEYFELDGNTENPVDEIKIDSWIPYTPDNQEDPSEVEDRLFARSAINHSNGSTFAFGHASIEAQEGKTKYDNDHALFREEYYKTLHNSGRLRKEHPRAPKVDIVFYPSIELLDDNGVPQTYSNVVLARLSNDSMLDAVDVAQKNFDWAKKKNPQQIVEEIQSRGYDILGSFRSVESDFDRKEEINFSSKSEVSGLIERIKKGFKKNGIKDTYYNQLVQLNTDMAAWRALGAQNPGQSIATVSLHGLEKGKVIYDNYKGQRSLAELTKKLESKGYKIGTPYFSSQVYTRKDAEGKKYPVASWAVRAWKIAPEVDGSEIILRTPEWGEAHLSEIKNEIQSMKKNKGISFAEINKSLPMIFLEQNKYFLVDRKTGEISSQVDGLKEFVSVDEGGRLKIKTRSQYTPQNVITSLSRAIDFLDAKRKSGGANSIAKRLRTAVRFTIGNFNQREVPAGQMDKLYTSAFDINHYGIFVNNKAINTSEITGVKNDVVANENETDDDIKNMADFDIEDDFDEHDGMYSVEKNPQSKSTKDNAGEDDELHMIYKTDKTFFAMAKRYFGDTKIANIIKKDVARHLIRYSNWNRDLTQPPVPLSQAIADTFSYYQRVADKISTAINVSSDDYHYEDFRDISGETVHLLSKNEFGRYVHYVLGKQEDAFFGMISKLIPSIDPKTMKTQDLAEAIKAVIEGDEALKILNRDSQSNVIENLDERPMTETLSPLVHLHIDHIPLKVYTKEESGEIVSQEAKGKTVDSKVLHKSLIDAAAMSHWPGQDEYMELEKIERWHRNLENLAMDSGVGSPKFNTIMSFIDVFFSEDPSNMSHKYIRDNSIQNLRFDETDPDKLTAQIQIGNPDINEEALKEKGKQSDHLLSALYSHFVSSIPRRAIQLQVKGFKEDIKYRQKTQSSAIGSQIAHNIKSRLNNSLFTLTEGGVEISETIKNQIMPGEKQAYIINADGIFRKDGLKKRRIVSFESNKKNQITEFSIPDNITADDIKSFLNILQINELLYTSTIRGYLETANDPNLDVEARRDRSMLAEIVGMIGLTTKTSIDDSGVEKKLVDNYYKKNGIEQDPFEDMNDDALFDLGKEGEEIYKPTDLYRLIENLSKSQSDFQMNRHSRHYYNVKNKMVQIDMNGSTI